MRIFWIVPAFLVFVFITGALLLMAANKKKAAKTTPPAPGQALPARVSWLQRIAQTGTLTGKALKAVFQAAITVAIVVIVGLFLWKALTDTAAKVKRPTSGAFLLEPGMPERKLVNTGLFYKKGEYIILEQDEPAREFWVRNTTMNDVKIESRSRTLQAYSPGELKLSPGTGHEPFRVRAWITSKRKLFGT